MTAAKSAWDRCLVANAREISHTATPNKAPPNKGNSSRGAQYACTTTASRANSRATATAINVNKLAARSVGCDNSAFISSPFLRPVAGMVLAANAPFTQHGQQLLLLAGRGGLVPEIPHLVRIAAQVE